jgi:hypothetical protein
MNAQQFSESPVLTAQGWLKARSIEHRMDEMMLESGTYTCGSLEWRQQREARHDGGAMYALDERRTQLLTRLFRPLILTPK